MSDYVDYALPKSEEGWLEGVQMKEEKDANLKRDIERHKRLLRDVPEPNCGRIQELKEKIRKKTLITKEAIEECAERLADRFLGRD